MPLRMRHTAVVVAPLALVVGITGCGAAEEPAGLNTAPATAEPDPTDRPETPEPEPTETPSPDDTPNPTFTQPYLAEDNVIELRDVIPIEPPDDATDEELDVLDAYGRYEAAWENIIQGLPYEESGIEKYTIDPNLSSTRDWAKESVELERVSVGPPTDIVALDMSIDDDTATIEICIDNRGWFSMGRDSLPRQSEEFLLAEPEMQRTDGNWKLAHLNSEEDASKCEDRFE